MSDYERLQAAINILCKYATTKLTPVDFIIQGNDLLFFIFDRAILLEDVSFEDIEKLTKLDVYYHDIFCGWYINL